MMGGFDHHGSIGEDWMFPIPSPRFFATVMKDDVPVENIDSNRAHFVGHEDINNGKNGARAAENIEELPKTRRGGGLLERIAARAGFNAPRLNTESIRPSDLSISQEVPSPYLTIPPGLSPTTLLESPVFLSNSLVQPSPTTGKFLFASSGSNNKNSSLSAMASDNSKNCSLSAMASDNSKNCSFSAMPSDNNKDQFFEDFDSQPFSFKPVADSGSALFHGDKNRLEPLSYHGQSFYGIEKSLQPQNGVAFPNPMEFWRPSSENNPASNSIIPETNTTAVAVQQQEEDVELRSGGVDEDGYNWRKYGHKQVKGSEYPRSYYKCTHLNCTVKKKVERSHEGVVTEIIYKGSHNHPEPLVTIPNHRSAIALDDQNLRMQPVPDKDSHWSMVQNRTVDDNWKKENLEANCLQAQKGGAHLDSSIVVDRSSTFSNDEDEDDQQEESESKRRKVEAYATEMTAPTRAIREPRVVVQTTSEVDILDDGYRWRKYGQKVVKGNPNPRSYYKCTSSGCTVRKHVERASHDLRSVITTYEGKHNHDVPAARNSSHHSSAGGSHHHLHRTDPSQVQNEIPRFDNRAAAAAAPLGSYGQQQMMGHHGFAYGSMNQTGMSLGSGMGSQGKMMPSLPMGYMGQQQNQMRLMMMSKAKEDPKLEPMSDQSININNNNIGNNGSSVYHQIMNRLTTPHGGPQM